MILKRKLHSTTEVVSNEEYSHLRALADKTPSVEGAKIQENFEEGQLEIEAATREKKLAGESKAQANIEQKDLKSENLGSRNEAVETLNKWLSGCSADEK